MTLRGMMVAEDREMDGSCVEARKLQFVVEAGLFIAVGLGRFAPLRLEILDDRGAHSAVFDIHDAPRLAVADGRRKIGETQQPIEQRVRNRICFETAHIAPPAD